MGGPGTWEQFSVQLFRRADENDFRPLNCLTSKNAEVWINNLPSEYGLGACVSHLVITLHFDGRNQVPTTEGAQRRFLLFERSD